MYKKLVNIKENFNIILNGRIADTVPSRDLVLIVVESKWTGTRKVAFSLRVSGYKDPGIAYGVVRRKFHELQGNIDEDRYRIFILDILDKDELQREGLDSSVISDSMVALAG